MCATSGSQILYLSLSRELGCAEFSLSVFSSSLRLSLYPLSIPRKGARRCARPPGRTGTTRRIDAARAVLRRTRRTWARATTYCSGPTGTTSRSTPRLRTPRGRRRSRRRPPRRTCRTSRCLRGPPRGTRVQKGAHSAAQSAAAARPSHARSKTRDDMRPRRRSGARARGESAFATLGEIEDESSRSRRGAESSRTPRRPASSRRPRDSFALVSYQYQLLVVGTRRGPLLGM
jgi:hypothetical protein